jgi:hypothetical protein
MARGYGELTAKKVEHLTTRGMHADGGGLYLQVAKGRLQELVVSIQALWTHSLAWPRVTTRREP